MSGLVEIIEGVPNATLVGDADGIDITSVTMDTRRLEFGALFDEIEAARTVRAKAAATKRA